MHLLLPCTITSAQRKNTSQTYAFIDCSTTAEFCDSTYVSSLHLLTYEIPHPLQLTVADGQLSSTGLITHATDLFINLNGHEELRTFYITNLGRYQLILGKPWLKKHNPSIDWTKDTLTFDKTSCFDHCATTTRPISVSRDSPHVSNPNALTPNAPASKSTSHSLPRRLGATAFHTLSKTHPDAEIFSISLYEIDRRLHDLSAVLPDETLT